MSLGQVVKEEEHFLRAEFTNVPAVRLTGISGNGQSVRISGVSRNVQNPHKHLWDKWGRRTLKVWGDAVVFVNSLVSSRPVSSQVEVYATRDGTQIGHNGTLIIKDLEKLGSTARAQSGRTFAALVAPVRRLVSPEDSRRWLLLDLLLKNGLVVDGTGNPGFYAAVGVQGETVSILRGDSAGTGAARVIDATGKVVCPGFIDMHAHTGLVILAEPEHHPKVRQGITTELVGVDGNSYAPFTSHDDFLDFVELNSGLDGAPTLPGRWSTVAEYLSMFDNKVAVNIAYIIGNSPIRISAMGWDDRPASAADLANMRAMMREGLEEGAFGLSTGLDYPPGSYADTDEIVALAEEAARLGGIYHTHLRNTLGDGFLDPVREGLEIGQRAALPCHLTHFYQRISHPGSARQLLDLVEGSVDRGQDVTMDCYPYTYSSSRALILIPQWAHDGGVAKLKDVLRSEEGRQRLRQEVRPRGLSWSELWLTYFKHPHNQRFEGRSVAAIAEMVGKGEVDTLCDLLLEEDLQTSYITPGPDLTTLPDFMTHPLTMVGTDALLVGDYPSPRTYGTFPTILAQYVRDEGSITLEEAIRKMTSFAALRIGIPDRGVLLDGMKADVVVFDPATVKSPSTRYDPKQYPIGIEYVLVNGRVVVDGGEHTGALPGRALRRGRAST